MAKLSYYVQFLEGRIVYRLLLLQLRLSMCVLLEPLASLFQIAVIIDKRIFDDFDYPLQSQNTTGVHVIKATDCLRTQRLRASWYGSCGTGSAISLDESFTLPVSLAAATHVTNSIYVNSLSLTFITRQIGTKTILILKLTLVSRIGFISEN